MMHKRVNLRKRATWLFVMAVLATATVVTSAGGARGPVGRFRTPFAPAFLAVDGGAVWVAAHRSGALYQIDPKTNKIVRTIQTNDDICDLWTSGPYLAVGTSCEPGLWTLVNPRSGKVVRKITNGLLSDRWGGSAWRMTMDGIVRLDPKTHVPLKRFHVRSSEGPAVKDAGSLWIPSDAWVTRIVLATNTETVIPLPGSELEAGPNQGYAIAAHLVAYDGKIWIGNPAGIYWIDEATNKATIVPNTLIGNLDQSGNIGISAGKGSVFARTGPNTITRIDASTGAVLGHYPAAGGGGDVLVGFGSLWATNFGIDTTWRMRLG